MTVVGAEILIDQGFAESFMLSEISCPDLVAFFRVCKKKSWTKSLVC